jgi:hypothetical protein
MTTWISHARAAEVAGCSVNTIENHLAEFVHRPAQGSFPSLDLASVEAWAARRREQRAGQRPRSAPVDETAPDDGDVWLDSSAAALVLGCTPQYAIRLAANGRLDAVRRGRRWWFRRSGVEQRAAARAFKSAYVDGAPL